MTRSIHTMRRAPLTVLAMALLLTACSKAGNNPTGVATNPASLPGGGALHGTTPTPAGSNAPQTTGARTVLAPLGLNLRSSASPTAQVLGTLAQGTLLTVVGYSAESGGWYRVQGTSTTG